MLDSGDKMVVKAKNVLGAKMGDEVEIYLSPGKKMKSLFIVYVIPVLGLLLGAFFGNAMDPVFGLSKELVTMLFTLAGLLLALFIVTLLSNRIETSGQMIPQISRITRRGEGSPDPRQD